MKKRKTSSKKDEEPPKKKKMTGPRGIKEDDLDSNEPISEPPKKKKKVAPNKQSSKDSSSANDETDVLALLSATPDEEPEEGDELLDIDIIEADNAEIPELDEYEEEGLDRREYAPLSAEARRLAEQQLEKQEKAMVKEKARARLEILPSFSDEEDEELGGEDFNEEPTTKKSDVMDIDDEFADISSEEDDDKDEAAFDISKYNCPLREWLIQAPVQREVKRRFRKFLRDFTDGNGTLRYVERIRTMCSENRESLDVSWTDLIHYDPLIAEWAIDSPSGLLPLFDDLVFDEVTQEGAFPDYSSIHSQVHVRISDIPVVETLRNIRQVHLNSLVRVAGVATRRTSVFPQLTQLSYTCMNCKKVLGPYIQENAATEAKPTECPECLKKGPFILNPDKSKYRNYQKITLQESPGSVLPGRIPRSKEVILLNDLIDTIRPGEEVEITGIYKNSFDRGLNTAQGFPVFKTVIEANHVYKREAAFDSLTLTEEDERAIRSLAAQPKVAEKIISSIAPSIYGHTDIKTAIALSLFGGVSKLTANGHKIRGDINVLLMGDPGTAKSQFLKYVEKTANRAVYTTGKGASAVGLTAAVHRDPITHEWTLEGGALVLADKGVCMIDEFDKMNDKDRTSIHEAMEQQSISISKAGIVTSLQARCSVIAAANPIKGRYDPGLPFIKNVDLTEAILSRFDITCVVRDSVDPDVDRKLAEFVVQSHVRSHPKSKTDKKDSNLTHEELEEIRRKEESAPISQDLLRKYIMYARSKVKPRLERLNAHKVASVFSKLRSESGAGGMPISIRHLESIIRLTEANAKMRLQDYASEEDLNVAIQVMLRSFIDSQKSSLKDQFQRKFAEFLTFGDGSEKLCYHTLQVMVHEQLILDDNVKKSNKVHIDCEDFERRLLQYNIMDPSSFYNSTLFKQNNYVLNHDEGVIVKKL
eukprot:TRINITY_DN2050_c0_g5_i1.p1 TRINITY_DN2050_c0_g5~~TRINITY_DN2050_c0_g5_i1.p1  ORF type:complete len:930 (-),score=221.70 TRINITY_DN2050_c0_g5_i1:43-2832(-)